MVDFSLTLEMTPTCHSDSFCNSERSEESQGLRSASGDGVMI